MLDERTEATLLEAMSTLAGGETVAVTRGEWITTMRFRGLVVTAYDRPHARDDVPETGDLTADDAVLAVLVMDAYLSIAEHIQDLPGAMAMGDDVRRRIKAVREKLRGMI